MLSNYSDHHSEQLQPARFFSFPSVGGAGVHPGASSAAALGPALSAAFHRLRCLFPCEHENAYFPNLGGAIFSPAKLRRLAPPLAAASHRRLSVPPTSPSRPPPTTTTYHRPSCWLDTIAISSAADLACCRRQDDYSRARVSGPENHQGAKATLCSPRIDTTSLSSPRCISCVSWAHQVDLCDEELRSFATRI